MFGRGNGATPEGNNVPPPEYPSLIPQRAFTVSWQRFDADTEKNIATVETIVCRQINQAGAMMLFTDVITYGGGPQDYAVFVTRAIPVDRIIDYAEVMQPGMKYPNESGLVVN